MGALSLMTILIKSLTVLKSTRLMNIIWLTIYFSFNILLTRMRRNIPDRRLMFGSFIRLGFGIFFRWVIVLGSSMRMKFKKFIYSYCIKLNYIYHLLKKK